MKIMWCTKNKQGQPTFKTAYVHWHKEYEFFIMNGTGLSSLIYINFNILINWNTNNLDNYNISIDIVDLLLSVVLNQFGFYASYSYLII